MTHDSGRPNSTAADWRLNQPAGKPCPRSLGVCGLHPLGLVLTFFTQWLQDVGSNGGDSEGFGSIGWGLVVVIGLVLNVLVSLWMNIGLFRAWIALSGRKPSWDDFYRWDGAAMGRLFLMALLLVGVNIVI